MDPASNQLPDFVLADLFKESLVVLDNEAVKHSTEVPGKVTPAREVEVAPTSAADKIPFSEKPLVYLGNNNKHISIVVNDEVALHVQEDLLEMLSAMLTACRLNLADVAIVNMHRQLVTDALLRSDLSPQTVLLFGVSTQAINLPFSIPDYKVQAYNNCVYLQAAALQQMNGKSDAARLEKSRLWVCLKNIFGV